MRIVEDDLSGPAIRALLEEHFAGMLAASPPGSCHFFDVERLKSPDVTFWSAWVGDELAGMGALKEIDTAHGEIKSMRTHGQHKRRGVAAAMLAHILDEARARGYQRLSLETGSTDPFRPAIALYESHGFAECPPFADYRPDPFSRFYTLAL